MMTDLLEALLYFGFGVLFGFIASLFIDWLDERRG